MIDIISIVLLAAVSLFLFWKVRYGFGYDDESFYITIPLRLMKGDAFISDEWHVSQLSQFILYPFVKLYISVLGTTDGIMLASRYAFVVLQIVVSTVIYLSLRKYGYVSIFASLINLLHFSLTIIFSLNYYSFGLIFTELTGLLFLSSLNKFSYYKIFLSGICIAFSVITNPFYAVFYVGLSVLTLVYEITKKSSSSSTEIINKKDPYGKNSSKFKKMIFKIKSYRLPFYKLRKEIFSFRSYLVLTVGIIVVSSGFLAFEFSRTTPSEFFENLPMIFTDYEHTASDGNQNIIDIVQSLEVLFSLNPIALSAFIVLAITVLFDRKNKTRKMIYAVLNSLILVFYMTTVLTSKNMFDGYIFWMMPFAVFSFIIYLLCENKRTDIFWCIYVPGVVMAVCLDISSDTGPRAATVALTMCCMAGVFFVYDLIKELREISGTKRFFIKSAAIILFSTLPLQIVYQTYINCDFSTVCFENECEENPVLDKTLQRGTHKGLITSAFKEEMYNNILSDLDVIKESAKENPGPFLVTENYGYCYTYLDELPEASYSGWFPGERWYVDMAVRLYKYYELHPEKTPKYIYIPYYDGYCQYSPEQAEGILEDIENHFNCETVEGKAGFIVNVK